MSRYIDADALKEHIEVITYEGMWHESEVDEFVSVENIDNAPSIDIEPKRGEWIDRSGGIEGAWNYCSVCGEQAIDLYDFCPNCGADMREVRDE